VERTITYEAPFDRCDRVGDYRVAWVFFEQHRVGSMGGTIYEDTNSKPMLDLLDRVHTGDMVLPDFQRDFRLGAQCYPGADRLDRQQLPPPAVSCACVIVRELSPAASLKELLQPTPSTRS